MPFEDDIQVNGSAPALLTESDITTGRFQNLSQSNSVRLKGAVGAVPPSNKRGGILLAPMQIIPSGMMLAALFPGTPGANRVYAFADQPSVMSVSYE